MSDLLLKRSLAFVLFLAALPARSQPATAPVHLAQDPNSIAARPISVEFHGNSIEDAMTELMKQAPGFHAVVVRDEGVPDTFVNFSLKNVPLSQIVELLQKAYPWIEFDYINYGDGPTWLVLLKVHQGPQTTGQFGVRLGPRRTIMLKVYRLAPIIRYQMLNHADAKDQAQRRKQATDDVLSLIEAALKEVAPEVKNADENPSHPLKLQIHPETQVLLVKGSEGEQAVVSSVLAALEPTKDDERFEQTVRQAMENSRSSISTLVEILNKARQDRDAAVKTLADYKSGKVSDEDLMTRLRAKREAATTRP